jgi:SAM-dependent methyltransferase
MSNEILDANEIMWKQKPIIKHIYTNLYERILPYCTKGATLEVGAGIGNLKNFMKDVISSDIVFRKNLDIVADAQNLPFSSNIFQNIVLFDVLHHIENPKLFLEEAYRTLRVGGKIIMIEPGITPFSLLLYKFFHDEPVIINANPFDIVKPNVNRIPFDANQAIPTILFKYRSKEFYKHFPNFKISEINFISLFVYPLSGGFKKWSLIPMRYIDKLLRLDLFFEKYLGFLLAFRLLIVIEKSK